MERRGPSPGVRPGFGRAARLLHHYVSALFVLALAGLPPFVLVVVLVHYFPNLDGAFLILDVPSFQFAHPVLIAAGLANLVASNHDRELWKVAFWLALSSWAIPLFIVCIRLILRERPGRAIALSGVIGLQLFGGVWTTFATLYC